MSNTSVWQTTEKLKGFSMHLPHVKLTTEEEARRFSNLKFLIAKARNITAPNN